MVWEERWHPLREEWVIVAAHRQNRPWSGETVERAEPPLPPYVADCYLCPGNLRVSGARNPEYESTFVFDNDLPCVGPEAPVCGDVDRAHAALAYLALDEVAILQDCSGRDHSETSFGVCGRDFNDA